MQLNKDNHSFQILKFIFLLTVPLRASLLALSVLTGTICPAITKWIKTL